METRKLPNGARGLIALACGSCTIAVILLLMNRDYPFVGHDYAYFVPHLIDTGLHIRLNGWTIQWYTPSFGGGLPGFPNPQHMQYSIVQLLSLWLDPWSAVLASTAAISLVGYYSFYKCLHQHLGLDWRASILGGMFFIGNGFYIEHLIAGQMGYQLFPLFGVILYALTDPARGTLYKSVIITIVLSMLIHQAGFYLIVILSLSLGITLPLLFLYKPEIINLKHLGWIGVITLVLTAALTASKVYATIAFMRHYPRIVYDLYEVGWFQAGLGVAGELLGVMNLVPILSFAQYNPDIIMGILSDLTGAEYGIWETDRGLSPVLIVFLLGGLAGAISSIRKNHVTRLDRSRLVAFILMAVAAWVTFEFATAKGLFYSLTKQLPVLKSLHINVRFVSAFIPPLVIIGAFQAHVFFLHRQQIFYFLTGVLLTIVSLFSYFSLSDAVHIRRYNAGMARETYESLQSERPLPVRAIADIDVWKGFSDGASSIIPYEPIFGYNLEEFRPLVHLGSVFEEENGYFNMTNPESLVFPEIEDLQPFERFKVSEQDKLERFLERLQPEWNIPMMAKILDGLSFITLIFIAGFLLVTSASQTKAALSRGTPN